MPANHHQQIGTALTLLRSGLLPFLSHELAGEFDEQAEARARRLVRDARALDAGPLREWDEGLLLRLLGEAWTDVFGRTLGRTERGLVAELREARDGWERQEEFLAERACRVLDAAVRLLGAVAAPEAAAVDALRLELLRARGDELARGEKKSNPAPAAPGGLLPWREVLRPHKDVLAGRYPQLEFAVDLWQVHGGDAGDELRKPAEFFRRTHCGPLLQQTLAGVLARLSGKGGEPMVLLQGGAGSGKSHALLALYHAAAGLAPAELAELGALARAADGARVTAVKRVVLAGSRISPATPAVKADGTVVRTLWGELAWQLGGRKLFQEVAAADAQATLPHDLRGLIGSAGPCVILVDDWLTYARQLHDHAPLPAGSLDTQLGFLTALADAARRLSQCVVALTLPTSDDPEASGERARAALTRGLAALAATPGSWRPPGRDEAGAVARRRLFEPADPAPLAAAMDASAQAFAQVYAAESAALPADCREPAYAARLQACYPFHPELLDQLLAPAMGARFERWRGTLRVLAAWLRSQWLRGDAPPLLLPADVPLQDARVAFELTRHLPGHWAAVIHCDVDGAAPAAQRVARALLLASLGPDPRACDLPRLLLGSLLPGEAGAPLIQAATQVAATATHLYQDGARLWLAPEPNVARLASQRAAAVRGQGETVAREIEQRLRADLVELGDFSRGHAVPDGSAAVPDDRDTRLVVLGPDQGYAPGGNSPAELAARAIWEARGNTPRCHRNAVVFLAADATGVAALRDAVAQFLAWAGIAASAVELDLSPAQVKQAEAERSTADAAVNAQVAAAYLWLLTPVPADDAVAWHACRLPGEEPLAVRASRRLRADGRLFASLSGPLLRALLEQTVWSAGDHLPLQGLAERFARDLTLPRLRDPGVLATAIRDGLAHVAWARETFAYAEAFDPATGRYRGLRCGNPCEPADTGLLVRAAVAQRQQAADVAAALRPAAPTVVAAAPVAPSPAPAPATPAPAEPPRMHRFQGEVSLDAARAGDLARIGEEILEYLVGNHGAEVRVTVAIDAVLPGGVPDLVQRAVAEACRRLRFTRQEFGPQ